MHQYNYYSHRNRWEYEYLDNGSQLEVCFKATTPICCGKCYLVDSTEGGHIHGLPPDGTSTTDTSGVLTGSAVDDGIHQDLEGVLGKEMEIVRHHWMFKWNHNLSTARTEQLFQVTLHKTQPPWRLVVHTSPVSRWMISKACLTMRTVISFLPLLRPCIIMELVRRSTMGHWALRKRLAA